MRPVRHLMIVALLCAVLASAACGSKVNGTYSNENGMIVLDVRSGGKASLTLMGQVAECTYEVEKEKLTLDCKGDKSVFVIHDDGSLTGPGFVGLLRKKK